MIEPIASPGAFWAVVAAEASACVARVAGDLEAQCLSEVFDGIEYLVGPLAHSLVTQDGERHAVIQEQC